MSWIAVTSDVGPEDAEAFGPFSSKGLAEKLVEEHDELGVRPAYPLMVVELFSVGELRAQIAAEKVWEAER